MTRIVEVPVRTVATCHVCGEEARVGKHEGHFVLITNTEHGIRPCRHALPPVISGGKLVVPFCSEQENE